MKRYTTIVVSVLALAAPATAAASPSASTDGTPSAQVAGASWGTGVEADSFAWHADEDASWGT